MKNLNNNTYVFFKHIREHAMYHVKSKHQSIGLEQGPTSIREDRILQQ